MRSRTFAATLIMSFALLATAACGSDSLLGTNQGRVRVILSGDVNSSPSADLAGATTAAANSSLTGVLSKRDEDASASDDRPSHWFAAANVTLSSILVRNLDGVLVNLVLALPLTVDVVQMEGGRTIQLPDGVLPVGSYDQVVLVMTAVQGTTHDGTIITIEPPGGGWTAVVPICPLEVAAGGTTTVGIDLMVRKAFVWADNHFHFQPRFRPALNCTPPAG